MGLFSAVEAIGTKDPDKLAKRITVHCTSDTEKAEVIYKWITRHIRYDWKAYLWFRRVPSDPRRVLKRKKAVCDGYSILFKTMCDAVGLDAYFVIGHVKGAFHREGEEFLRGKHAWNGLMIEGKPSLIDATWGTGYLGYRKQPLRAWLYKKFEIPYLPKFKFVRRGNMDYFMPHPDSLIQTHLPIDPKWQLRDSAVVLEEWEKDSLLPRQENYYMAEIQATSALTEVQRQVLDGTHGLQYNVEDPFDLGAAQVAEVREIIKTYPFPQADTAEWADGVKELSVARGHLVASKAVFVKHHRQRLVELGLRRRSNFKAEGKAIRDGVVARNQWRSEMQRHSRLERTASKLTLLEDATATALRDPRALRIRTVHHLDSVKWRPILQAMAKSAADVHRLDSSIAAGQLKFLALSDSLAQQQDSLIGLRAHALQNIRHYTWEMMMRKEVQFYRGCLVLRAIEDSVEQLARHGNSFIKQINQILAKQNAEYVQVNRLYLKMLSQSQKLLAMGVPIETVEDQVKKLSKNHNTWCLEEKGAEEVRAAIHQTCLEKVAKGYAIADRSGFLGRWQKKVFGNYHAEMWTRQNSDFANDMWLASDFIRGARSGTSVLRRNIALWLAEKRREEAAAKRGR